MSATPVIPENITVHLGTPTSDAENIQVSFIDYIKNVASSEIFPTWPENAIRANVLAQISFALNRIYTEYYPSRGYDFDITNSTQFDQFFVPNREIFENISQIVDDTFNDYVVRQGNVEPLFTQYCNGTTVTCDGLSQWGTVALANQGLVPYEILQRYYGDDIDIVFNAPVEQIIQSYPGAPLKLGSSGNSVRLLEVQLNRIRRNYPAIPNISNVNVDFDVETEAAVKEFQKIFNLEQTGEVDKATWYKIKTIFSSVKKLGELNSEGVNYEDVKNISPEKLQEGDTGREVRYIQYYLAVLGYFNDNLPLIALTGVYDEETKNSVLAFQRQYGLPETGIMDRDTWNKLVEVYFNLIASLPPGYSEGKAEIFPGYVLTRGMRDANVRKIQEYLSFIAQTITEIPKVDPTGYYGDVTYNAVKTFQKLYNLNQTGVVGALTWNKIAEVYDELKGF